MIIYLAELYEEFMIEGKTDWRVQAEKCFLTEEAANAYALSFHPNALSEGYDYTWPDDGTKTWRCYWVSPIVLEDK